MRNLFVKLGIHDISGFLALARQFIKFGLVGILNTLLALAIYYTLVLGIGAHYILSNTIAFMISVLNAYYLNSKYVFKQGKGNRTKRLAKVYASYGFTFLVSTGLLFLMVDIFGISEIVAPVINLCVTVPLNFTLNKFWAFR